jgi:hypothetical protein
MTSEVHFERAFGLYSGGRRPAYKPQRTEPLVTQAPKEIRHMASTTTAITAPCGSCAHEPVCIRTVAVRQLAGHVDVNTVPMPPGLTIAIRATIECDAYMAVKGLGRGGLLPRRGVGLPGRVRTDEDRAKASERRLAQVAAKRGPNEADAE